MSCAILKPLVHRTFLHSYKCIHTGYDNLQITDFHEDVRRSSERNICSVCHLTLFISHIMTVFYIHFPEPNFTRVGFYSVLMCFCFLFLKTTVLSHFILRKKKVPSKSPSLAFAASSEDDILSWHKAQSSNAAFLKPWLTVKQTKKYFNSYFSNLYSKYSCQDFQNDITGASICTFLYFFFFIQPDTAI